MFKLLRYFSAASLVAILATAVLATWLYRQVAVEGIMRLAERSNVHLARTAMNPIRPALVAYLDGAAELRPGLDAPALPPALAQSIQSLMQDHAIAKIKLYTVRGVVAFSTRPDEIGTDRRDNAGFAAAVQGRIASSMIYRDSFNSFDGVTEKDNLMQTYLPVRASPTAPIAGVFELYADVNELARETERTEFIVMAGVVLILLALYAVLIVIVRRASHTIELQQRTIRERTETLELLSAHMLRNEESQKKKLAFALHERLAQTLSALKLLAESSRNDGPGTAAAARVVEQIVPALREAIEEVRSMATELRPASLDDLGLLPTLRWFCREYEERHPGLRVAQRIEVREQDVPASLKPVIYRIVVSALDEMAQREGSAQLHLALQGDERGLRLQLDDLAGAPATEAPPPTRAALRPGFARMEELTTLSGGRFTARHPPDGGIALQAAWRR